MDPGNGEFHPFGNVGAVVSNETAIIFGGMLFELWELDETPVTFKKSLWHTLVNHATVYADERIVFQFKDGTEITTML